MIAKAVKRVSVAMATYNGAKYIERQLESILKQSYHIDEIIIVDDCSTDNTVQLLLAYASKYENIKVYVNESNLRSNLAFKKAASLTNCDYVAFCDQDDIWDLNKIELQMEAITKLEIEMGEKDLPLLIYHDLRLMNEGGIITHDSFWKLHKFLPDSFTFTDLFLFNVVTGCTCLINKKLKTEMLKCNMEGIIMHDYLIALIAYGYGRVVNINKSLMCYRSHSSSVTVKETLSFFERIKSLIIRMRNREYLMPNIKQIDAFLNLYKDCLDKIKVADANSFVQLKSSCVLRRMKYKWFKK